MGEFFDPNPPKPHECIRPIARTPGAGWRCDCGRAYVSQMVFQHGESWIEWARSPKHDRPVAARPNPGVPEKRFC